MGTKRRASDHRISLRAQRREQERETLLPCPGCDGSGSRVIEQDLRYRHVGCRWCGGSGCVDFRMSSVFARWRRIRMWNVARGACGSEKEPK